MMRRFFPAVPIIILAGIFLASPLSRAAEEALSWEDCVREAAVNHPDLVSAVENVQQSRSQEDITASALYPQVTAGLSAQTAKSAGSSVRAGGTSDTYSYDVTGSQLVFDGFKTLADVKGAREDTQAAKENYRFVSADVRQRLRSAFVSVMKAQAQIRVTEEIVRIRKDNLVLISLRYQSGLEHKGALMTAEANLAQARFEVEEAKRALIVAQRQLTKEMGRSEFIPMAVKEDFEIGDTEKKKPDFREIVEKNPSLLEEAALARAARYGVASAKANFFPVLSASSGIGRTSGHWPPQNNQWNLGLGLTLPLFEGGLKTAQLKSAKSSFVEAQANQRSTRDSVILGLEQTWAFLQDAIEDVSVRRMFLDATQERSRIAQAQYSIGMMSYDNWTIIEDDLVSAKKDLLNAQANALFAQANWVEAKGETLEQEQ